MPDTTAIKNQLEIIIMRANLGSADRIARGLLGLAVIAAGVYFKSWFGAVGIVLLGTALISWCPVYLPFGLNTIRKKLMS